MHAAQSYVSNSVYAGIASAAIVQARVLTASEAGTLALALRKDAADCCYCAVVSLGDALLGVERGLYSWATVKLYYCVFYASRASLAVDGIGLVYLVSKPYALRALAGEHATRQQGQTHKAVLGLFESSNTDPFLLSQQIGTDAPFDWLMALREEANYRRARFWEPDTPDHFRWVAERGVRQMCQHYATDTTGLYAFDEDHAAVAFPLTMVSRTCAKCSSAGIDTGVGAPFVQSIFRDRSGPLAPVLAALK